MIDVSRPYLVIPKLIAQPTWGGNYIINFKNWQQNTDLSNSKIGQAYELFHDSNLSLITESNDPEFQGEMCLTGTATEMTNPPNSVSLAQLIAENPEGALGQKIVARYGDWLPLLIKFTQALGNSFQIHIKEDATHPKWKPKPESWYYFEPGIITLGVKTDVKWQDYQAAVTSLNDNLMALGEQIKLGQLKFETAREKIQKLIKQYNPLQYVNNVEVKKDELLDLTACGIHHSWEEDIDRYPWGNVLYELQLNVMDEESTIRAYDKGKITPNGNLRPLQIADYFAFIDRSNIANTPSAFISLPKPLRVSRRYELHRLLETKYYTLEKIHLKTPSWYTEKIERFRHLFVKSGTIEVFTSHTSLLLTAGHSCFIPAAVNEYGLKNVTPDSTILISY